MDYKQAFERTYKQWKLLNWSINKVTAPHRHGNKISKEALDELANKQIDVEGAIAELMKLLEIKPPIVGFEHHGNRKDI